MRYEKHPAMRYPKRKSSPLYNDHTSLPPVIQRRNLGRWEQSKKAREARGLGEQAVGSRAKGWQPQAPCNAHAEGPGCRLLKMRAGCGKFEDETEHKMRFWTPKLHKNELDLARAARMTKNEVDKLFTPLEPSHRNARASVHVLDESS